MMTTADTRRLSGRRIGLSLSAAPDMPGADDAEYHINALTFQMGGFLLSQGAALALGHQWRPDGILEHLAHRAFKSQWIQVGAPAPEAPAPPRIISLLAWPDAPPDSDRAARRLIQDGMLLIRCIEPPGGTGEPSPAAGNAQERLATPEGQLARIRALTAVRRELAALSDARLCLGGAGGNPLRRLPGIIEEALCTWLAGKPLYISSAIGGAAKAMADVLLQRRLTAEAEAMFFTPNDSAALLAAAPAPDGWPAELAAPSATSDWNALRYFQEHVPLETLASRAGLTLDEYINLLTTPDPNRALGWLVEGLTRPRAS